MAPITVLVPSYNHAPFVERTLRSIFAQTLAPARLIVIDDGSKDESATVIERVLADCPFEHEFVSRPNRGLCATLNEGFARREGEFFAYISSDDVWMPEFLESRLAVLRSRPGAALAYGYSYLIDGEDNIIDSTRNWGEYADGDALPMLLYPMIPASASVLYRNSALERVSWNEQSILEDYELYLRLTAIGEFALDNRILSGWRIHGYNTSSDFPRMMGEWLAAQERVAPEIGIGSEDLRRYQSALRFRCVADLIRHGHRREAWRNFTDNRRSAGLSDQLKMLARFAVPRFVFDARRWLVRGKVSSEQ